MCKISFSSFKKFYIPLFGSKLFEAKENVCNRKVLNSKAFHFQYVHRFANIFIEIYIKK